MGFLTRLFGQTGTVRFEGEDTNGVKFTGKVKIEAFNVSNEELRDYLIRVFHVETGRRAKWLTITGFIEN